MKRYTDEYLLDHLRELAAQIGRTPTRRDIDNAGIVKIYLYTNRFGKLGKAQKAAGLVPSKRKIVKKYSDEYLLNHLRELAAQLGKTPTESDIKKAGKGCCLTYRLRFGGIDKAMKAVGLVPNKRGRRPKYTNNENNYSDEDLLNHLRELSIQLGRTPSKRRIDNAGKVKYYLYLKRFGKFGNAQEAAGLVPNKKGKYLKYSDEDLLKHLKELSEKLGKTPSCNDLDEAGKGCHAIYIRHFGNINNAQKAAGLVPNKRVNQQKYFDEDLLNHLKELSEKLGRTPSCIDIDNAGKGCHAIYIRHFGNISNAQKAAGLVPNKTGRRQKYSDKQSPAKSGGEFF